MRYKLVRQLLPPASGGRGQFLQQDFFGFGSQLSLFTLQQALEEVIDLLIR